MSLVMSQESVSKTREKIILAAERLFAEVGFGAASMREITESAGVNLAAVNYHFSSKEGLLNELMKRRILPMNKKRLALLKKFEDEAGLDPIPLRKIFVAFLEPFFDVGAPGGKPDLIFVGMLARAFSERPEFAKQVYTRYFKHIQAAFIEALQATCPLLSKQDMQWRFHFALSLMMASMSQRLRLGYASGGMCDPEDFAGLKMNLLDFICAGFESEPGNLSQDT